MYLSRRYITYWKYDSNDCGSANELTDVAIVAQRSVRCVSQPDRLVHEIDLLERCGEHTHWNHSW
jgi:hypothetical protein